MPKDLLTPRIPAPLLEQATNGQISLIAQRNWAKAGYFRTYDIETPEPRAGKPRMFTLLHVYEAAMLGHASRSGIPLHIIATAFRRRIGDVGERQIIAENPRPIVAFWEGDVVEAAVRSQQLREFETRAPDAAAYWIINLVSRESETQFANLTVCDQPSLQEAITAAERQKDRASPQSLLINVTDIVTSIDNALANLGVNVETSSDEHQGLGEILAKALKSGKEE
jgi:hypothetical protein